jgi:hypothetical protein
LIVVNFLAETADVHLDKIRFRVEVIGPDVFDDFGPRDWVWGAEEKQLQEQKFLGTEWDQSLSASHGPALPVELEIRAM